MAQVTVDEPFPISLIAGHYLLFDVNVITYIRREHHITGVLTGNIPQASQQNIFSGIPLQLMPEEARLLVIKGHAYVADDVSAHEQFGKLDSQDRKGYLNGLHARGLQAAQAFREQANSRKAVALAKQKSKKRSNRKDASFETSDEFAPPEQSHSPAQKDRNALQPWHITPTTSYPLLDPSHGKMEGFVPQATKSYALYEHVHSKGYFLMPGLRFGCAFMAYPGDPLRFHSHFLVTAKGWDEPIDLLDLVGGGRLGTGVKKGYLLGGVEEKDHIVQDEEKAVRTFTFEWAAM